MCVYVCLPACLPVPCHGRLALLVGEQISRNGPPQSPVAHSIPQVVMHCLSTRMHWGTLDLIHSTVNVEIAFVLLSCRTLHIRQLTPLLRR
jgi:hypothetical protein